MVAASAVSICWWSRAIRRPGSWRVPGRPTTSVTPASRSAAERGMAGLDQAAGFEPVAVPPVGAGPRNWRTRVRATSSRPFRGRAGRSCRWPPATRRWPGTARAPPRTCRRLLELAVAVQAAAQVEHRLGHLAGGRGRALPGQPGQGPAGDGDVAGRLDLADLGRPVARVIEPQDLGRYLDRPHLDPLRPTSCSCRGRSQWTSSGRKSRALSDRTSPWSDRLSMVSRSRASGGEARNRRSAGTSAITISSASTAEGAPGGAAVEGGCCWLAAKSSVQGPWLTRALDASAQLGHGSVELVRAVDLVETDRRASRQEPIAGRFVSGERRSRGVLSNGVCPAGVGPLGVKVVRARASSRPATAGLPWARAHEGLPAKDVGLADRVERAGGPLVVVDGPGPC